VNAAFRLDESPLEGKCAFKSGLTVVGTPALAGSSSDGCCRVNAAFRLNFCRVNVAFRLNFCRVNAAFRLNESPLEGKRESGCGVETEFAPAHSAASGPWGMWERIMLLERAVQAEFDEP
jgi:hypothetical protein